MMEKINAEKKDKEWSIKEDGHDEDFAEKEDVHVKTKPTQNNDVTSTENFIVL